MAIVRKPAVGFYRERDGTVIDSGRALRVEFILDANVSDSFRISYTEAGLFTGVQTIYVDNADYAGTITLNFTGLGQRIVVPPSSQGYYTVTDQQLVLEVVATAAASANPIVWFYNMSIQSDVWYVGP